MTYLTAYRKQSAKYGNDRGKLSSPEPYKPKTRPLGDNDNAPRPANDNERPAPKPANDNRLLNKRNVAFGLKAAKALAKLPYKRVGLQFIRVNPYLNLALTALDLWNTFGRADQSNNTGDAIADYSTYGFILQQSCVGGQPPTHLTRIGSFGPFLNSLVCLAGQAFSPNTDMYTRVDSNTGQMLMMHYTHTFGVTNYYSNSQWWYRPALATQKTFLPKYRTWKYPDFVVPDPNLLPIKWPMPYPLPLPMHLVNNRVNDPLGSQRTNGDKKPTFTVREPPKSGDREKKLSANAVSAVLALQRVAHGVTEAIDVIDAVHKALPKKLQAKAHFNGKWYNASPQAKAAAIYANWNAINFNKAVINLIVNDLGDRVIGRSNAAANKALNNSPIGRINRGVAF